MTTEKTLDEEMAEASKGIGEKLQQDRAKAIAAKQQPEPVALEEVEEQHEEPKE